MKVFELEIIIISTNNSISIWNVKWDDARAGKSVRERQIQSIAKKPPKVLRMTMTVTMFLLPYFVHSAYIYFIETIMKKFKSTELILMRTSNLSLAQSKSTTSTDCKTHYQHAGFQWNTTFIYTNYPNFERYHYSPCWIQFIWRMRLDLANFSSFKAYYGNNHAKEMKWQRFKS